jgi:hypothetical protein
VTLVENSLQYLHLMLVARRDGNPSFRFEMPGVSPYFVPTWLVSYRRRH